MKRIKKYQGGSYFRLPSLSSEFQTGASYVTNVPYINTQLQQYITNTGNFSAPIPTSNKVKDNTLKDTVSNIGSSIIGKASDAVSDKIFGDSELGRNLGTIFSSGLNSVGDTVLNNAIKKAALTDGLTKNLGSSVGGAVAGLGANYLGRGITSILGNNAASRFLGQSASTVGGTIGGKILSSGTKNLFSGPGSINPIGLGMSAVGAGLSAATGPSKEYNGTYGSTTKALDTVYDALQAGIGLAPGGQIISGALALNKGLSNLFGSTDGMTSTDAILGSAFMPAPIKWLNMLGSSKTGTFNKQSWQNTQKTSNFMQNAFGDLEDKFSKAREEAGKIYGTFSQGAKKRAQDNIDFSNFAWNKILNMADQNEYQNIRSSDMASINNQRYAQWIQGGFSPLARGKNGMKIFNNSINHNLGQRLLSGAALIDSKQMILSAQNGTKIKKKGIKSGINVDYYDPGNVMSVVANNPNKTIVLDEMTVRPYNKLPIQSELFQGMTNQAANEKADEYVNRVTPTAEDLLNIGTLGGLNNLSPTQWARRAYDLRKAIKGNMSWDKFGNNWFYGNKGLVSDKYAQEHPYASAAINLAGDIGAFGTFSALRKLPKYATLMKAENKASQEATALNWRDMLSNSVKRTRVGDVEIDNPGLYYHQSDAGKAKNFVSTGRMRTPLEEYWLAKEEAGEHIPTKLRAGIEPGYPQDPGSAMFSQGNLWYDKLDGTRVNPKKPDLLVTAREMPIANKNASIMSDKASLKALYEQGTRRVTNDNIYTQGPHTSQNTAAYTWEPEYGYRRVFAEETPTLNWADATRTPRITAENASSMTPKQWTAAQDAAIARGDMAEAQRLRDLHFRTYQKGDMVDINGNPIHVYHGSPEENIIEFYKPNDPRLPIPKGINFKATGEEGIYTSPRKGYAANYMEDLGGRYRVPLTKEQKTLLKAGKTREEIGLPSIPQGRIYDLYSNTKLVPENLDIDFNPFTLSTKEAKLIKSKGYTGFNIPGKKHPEHVVLEPNQLKLADAVTYDDNGVRIGLGERDNFNINDNRYSWIPWFLGGSTAATLYNKSK